MTTASKYEVFTQYVRTIQSCNYKLYLHITPSNHRFILPGTHFDDVARPKESESHEMIPFFRDILMSLRAFDFHWVSLENYSRHAHHPSVPKSSTTSHETFFEKIDEIIWRKKKKKRKKIYKLLHKHAEWRTNEGYRNKLNLLWLQRQIPRQKSSRSSGASLCLLLFDFRRAKGLALPQKRSFAAKL